MKPGVHDPQIDHLTRRCFRSDHENCPGSWVAYGDTPCTPSGPCECSCQSAGPGLLGRAASESYLKHEAGFYATALFNAREGRR